MRPFPPGGKTPSFVSRAEEVRWLRQRAEQAEARLARVVEAMEKVLQFEASFGENDIPAEDRALAFSALAAARGER